ncbi:MAG: YjbH domain-containing protein [Gammaproteobacteria bacterium]
MYYPRSLFVAALILAPLGATAQPNSLGQSGLIHMPDGRVEPDGTLRGGVTYMAPYGAIWGSVTLVPWLEFSGRFTRADDVPAFGGDTGYGDYKDKAFDFKIRLIEESGTLPAIAFGRQDFHGTGKFPATFVAASKAFSVGDLGHFDLTAGWGKGRFDGAFGGLRWHQPWIPNLALVAEYDAYDYENDNRARRLGEVERDGGIGIGIEYTQGVLHGQLARQDGHWGFNLGMTIPLQRRTFVPKTNEPPPVPISMTARPNLAAWQANDPAALAPVVRSLMDEGFNVSRILVTGDQIEVAIFPGRMSTIGRVAGRAARVVAVHAPAGLHRLELTIQDTSLPVITYHFSDLATLRAWIAGEATPGQLQATLSASYPDAAAHVELVEKGATIADLFGPRDGAWRVRVGPAFHGFPMAISRNVENPALFSIQPINFGFVFNDASGVVKYDIYALGTVRQWLGSGWYYSTSLRLTVYDGTSDTVGQSNSRLPRVRSEFYEYRKQSGRVKLDSAFIGHLANPRDRVYTWVSAGVYEEMFTGIGGEVLYLPEIGNWAADFSAHAVKQRDFEGWLGHQQYSTVTALAGFHYRFPKQGVTLSARAGRFLAKDSGVRFEMRRRFLSGFEVGGWYTHTDANDIMSPGTPENPYHDKGVFIRYSLGPILPRDSYAGIDFSMSPWQRDPGQMVRAPGGLYQMFERRLLLNLEDLGPWSDFGQ